MLLSKNNTLVVVSIASLVLAFLSPYPSTSVARASGPFVAAFDRFARHGEIDRLSAGRLLVIELSCVRCHASEHSVFTSMGLTAKGGPRLDGVATRLNLEWVERFIAAPQSVNPGTTMPDILGERDANERAAIARALTAFLSTQRQAFTEVKGSGLLPVPHEFWRKGDAARGRLIYHQVGCVACHEGDEHNPGSPSSQVDQLIANLDADQIAEMGLSAAARATQSVPFGDLISKYNISGLSHFLLDPGGFRPDSRMPSLKLSPVEAADIASYFLAKQPLVTSGPEYDDEQIALGRKLFVDLNCVQCHTASDLKPRRIAKSLAELDLSQMGCLTASRGAVANYDLDKLQSDTIQEAIDAVQRATQLGPSEQLKLQLLTFNCYACHERDGRGGIARFRRDHFETVAKVDLGDEGRLPPTLTGVGRKLRPTWIKSVLMGKKTDIRPHMQIRMPTFHAELANRMPELFQIADKAEEKHEPDTPNDARELAEAGRQLMDVGCVQCHEFGGNALPGVIGVNIRELSERVRPQWFREFLLDPGRVKAKTRMPSFFPEGKSQRPDLLDGDVDRQISAMWTYLNSKDAELPEKIKAARAKNYELQPTNRPIVLRTFMKSAGTHAIAVGFPEKTHYAFDAENIRLAIGWRGPFLDAQGTWFVRFAPLASPLGESIIEFPSEVPLARLGSASEAWPTNSENYRFAGYRLDATGVPVLLYSFAGLEVEDRIEPSEPNGLRRVLTLRTDPLFKGVTKIWLLALAGKKLTRVSDQAVKNELGLNVTLKKLTGTRRTSKGREEWLVPIEFEKSISLELDYQW